MTDSQISQAIAMHENNIATWQFLASRGQNCDGAIAYDLARIAHYKAMTPRAVRVFNAA